MTVASEVAEIEYAGDGATVAFAIPFGFSANADIAVSTRDSSGDATPLSTGFAITGAGTGSGTCTFTTAPASGTTVRIEREPEIVQGTDYTANDAFPAEATESALDQRTYVEQFLRSLIKRCIQVPAGDGSIDDMVLGAVSTRANTFLGFDSAGNLDYLTSIGATVLSQAVIGQYLYPRTDGEISAGVTPTAYYYPAGDVRRYGAVGDGTTDCTTAIQNALLTGHEVYIPEGTWKITASIELDDYQQIRFASRNSIIKGNLTAPLIRGRAGTSDRTYGVQIYSGTLDNTSRSNAGGIGLDFLSMTMAKVFGTQIKNVETAVRNGGASSLGAFYNEFHAVDIITVTTGYSNGTLGNENKVFGGRINDCTTGTSDNDNSCNSYFGIAIEVFTTAHRVSNTSASLSTRFYGSRLENAPSSGTAFSIDASAQDTLVDWPYITGVSSTGLPSAGSAPAGLRTTVRYSELFSESGTTAHKGVKKVTVTRDVASLASGGFRQEGPITVTGAAVGDSVKLTLPSAFPNNLMVGPCIVTNADTVYFLLHNPSGGAVDPASMDYVFEIADYT